MCTGGQHAANFFHLVGVLVSAQRLKDTAQDIIYSPEEEIKVLVVWLNYYYFVLLDYFLTSLIKSAL